MVASGKLQLRIAGKQLKDLDWFSKSDPVCLLEEWDHELRSWRVRGQTERIDDNLDPVFERPLELNLREDGSQLVKLTMWDDDGGGDFELIGLIELPVSLLREHAQSGQVLEQPLTHPEKPRSRRGNILVTVTQL